MKENVNEKLFDGFQTAFIEGNLVEENSYQPRFISNNKNRTRFNTQNYLINELEKCDDFKISVAFITYSGIVPLLGVLSDLEKRGVNGQILTTNYLSFSDPKAIKRLNELDNVTVKMFDVNAASSANDREIGFHTKGYIFRRDELYRIIIGSSNMTGAALSINREWNTELISTKDGAVAKEILKEFNEFWNSEFALDFDEFYEVYKQNYETEKTQRQVAREKKAISLEKYTFKPNSMQTEFIIGLRNILEKNEDRALLISATATGKTYASAFAMRDLGFRRVLFLVHRNQLARQTLKSYKKVFSENVKMGLIYGSDSIADNIDNDYLFATVQTLSKEDNLKKFEPDAFDAIILDEAHHSPANTYQKIMKYFTPKLWLGMTATPDKRDDYIEGRNVYELFNHNIAHEIRLQQAMDNDLLCPFHYFGITDLEASEIYPDLINGTEPSERFITPSELNEMRDNNEPIFNYLISDTRVSHILEKAEYFGYSGNKVKGLIFCSSIKESRELSEKINERINPDNGRNYRTVALNGDAPESLRQQCFERLAAEEGVLVDGLEPLDYILSVEILNEGVDIVEINQVIMIRPTQSPIVFVQQLGRGLRKNKGKEFVVIIDFIRNYDNNYMIPIALSGDRTYNKDNVRRDISKGVILGASTVYFDEISKKRIFESVDRANFSDIKLIKENYRNLKDKLGKIPKLKDFDKYGEMDVLRIFDNKSLGSYHKFLSKYEKSYDIKLSKEEEKVIEFISKKFASGKRIQELQLLKRIIRLNNRYTAYYNKTRNIAESGLIAGLSKDLEAYNKHLSDNQKDNIVNVLTNDFPTGTGKNTYKECIFIEKEGEDYKPSDNFVKMLANEDFYEIVDELIDFGISRYKRDYMNCYGDSDLVLNQKYTYEDVCRLLNWETNIVPLNMGGYKYDKKTNTFPVFINYNKEDDISDTIKYEDHFISNKMLIAISKSGRTVESEDVQNFLHAKERGITVMLFVRKNKDDKISKEFYFLGTMTASGWTKEFVMDNTDKTAVEIEWILDNPVREDIYDYLIN
ncbi:MAG: DEAD/DEAH box helicase [Lachnospiraceae bacterium]|nr:DEAD/DEAH box helicase [Lachnospiraceae bacterium]